MGNLKTGSPDLVPGCFQERHNILNIWQRVMQESIAVTQNFVSSVGLRQCMAFLKTGNPDLVSGCLQEKRTDLHQRFLTALQEQCPEVRGCSKVPCAKQPQIMPAIQD